MLEDLDIPALTKKRLDLAVTNTKDKFQRFNEFDAIMNAQGIDQEGNAQMHNPYSWSTVETIVTRELARVPSVNFSSRVPNDPQADLKSKQKQALWDEWYDKSNFFMTAVPWAKEALAYGTSILKVTWKTQTQEVSKYRYDESGLPALKEGTDEYDTETVEVTKYDDPYPEHVDPYHFFVDPNATSLEDARWVIHRYLKTYEELEDETVGGKPLYDNLDELKDRLTALSVTDTNMSPEDAVRHEYAYGRRSREDSTVDHFLCYEMWDKEAGTMCVVAAGEVVIREQPWPYWHGKFPFVRQIDSIVPHEFYGKGEIEPVLHQQYALDTMDSIVTDNAVELQENMWKVSGSIDETELVRRPNGVIHYDKTLGEDVEPIEMPNILAPGLQVREQYKSDMQQALGITDYTQAADSTIDRTATGTNLKSQQQNARFQHKIQLFENAVEEVAWQVMSLYQQYVTQPRLLQIEGPDGQKFPVYASPQDLASDFSVKVRAGSTAPLDKTAQRQDALELYQLFSQYPDPGVQFQAARELVATFDEFPLLLQAIEKSGAQQGGQADPQLAQAQQQHEQQMQAQQQQAQAQMAQQAQMHQQQMQLKMAELNQKNQALQGQMQLEQTKQQTAAISKQPQAPHISEIIPFQNMPAVAQDALLKEVGLPTGAVAEQAQSAQQDAQMAQMKAKRPTQPAA